MKCTDLRVGRIGPLSVAGHNLGASLRCSHAECRVRVSCTQMGKHCIVSTSFPKCKKSKLDAERLWSHARTKNTEPKRTKKRSIMSVAGYSLRASLLCSHAECLVRVR